MKVCPPPPPPPPPLPPPNAKAHALQYPSAHLTATHTLTHQSVSATPNTPWQPPDIYKMESIVKKRGTGRNCQYLIKWEGYDETENTWEPEKNIVDKAVLEGFLRSSSGKGGQSASSRSKHKAVVAAGTRPAKKAKTQPVPTDQPIQEPTRARSSRTAAAKGTAQARKHAEEDSDSSAYLSGDDDEELDAPAAKKSRGAPISEAAPASSRGTWDDSSDEEEASPVRKPTNRARKGKGNAKA